jgi:hypothetical protein
MHGFTVLEWFTGSLGRILDSQRLQAHPILLQPILPATDSSSSPEEKCHNLGPKTEPPMCQLS